MHRLNLAGWTSLALILISTSVVAGTLDRIKETGTFKLGYRTDAPPFADKNAVGEAEGYSVALCREVAEEAKRELHLDKLTIKYVPVTAENRFKMVQDGSVDILCGATTQTLSRRRIVDFSLPIFIDGASVLYRGDGAVSFDMLAGKKIGVRAGTTTEKELQNTLHDLGIKADVVAVKSHFDGLKDVESGKISAYFADWGILLGLLQRSDNPQILKLSSRQFTHEPYALALARGDDDFRLLVDTTLSHLYASGAIVPIFSNAFSPAQPSNLLKAIYIVNSLPN